jgi:hypothetical protein
MVSALNDPTRNTGSRLYRMSLRRPRILLARTAGPIAFVFGAAVSGCTIQYANVPGQGYQITSVQPHGPVRGAVPINPSPPPLSAPPPGPAPPAPPSSLIVPDGSYSGVAFAMGTVAGHCASQRAISGFSVRNGKVRWARFRGNVDVNGGIQMVSGRTWFIGQYEDGQISGTIQGSVCTYQFQLARTA